MVKYEIIDIEDYVFMSDKSYGQIKNKPAWYSENKTIVICENSINKSMSKSPKTPVTIRLVLRYIMYDTISECRALDIISEVRHNYKQKKLFDSSIVSK